MAFRRPTPDERRLLVELATIAGMGDPDEWMNTLQVQEMNDGGMGSLRLASDQGPGRSGNVVVKAAVQFTDADGVEVVASLYSAEDGTPFELDVWKTNCSGLVRIPDSVRQLEE